MDLISPLLLFGSLALTAHALFSLYLLLYSWEYPERLESSRGPASQREPVLGFTVLLAARHEEVVIRGTIRRIWAARYPRKLLQIIVVCHDDDVGTIKEVRKTIRQIGSRRIKLVTFSGEPINKPRALNVGLEQARHPVIAVFDAEDDVDPDVFSIVNTVMLEEQTGIVQSGVQLMNFTDHWFSVHNCLEYFFWFKSRLHFHARVGMIPLGGNTIFMRRDLIDRVGGWDATCLTEDADIGLRLSTLGEPVRVIYDAQHVTREETPSSIESLIRQRTRWNQGFMHVLRKGSWLQLPTWQQRALAIYTFSYPFVQAPMTLIWPLAVLAGLFLKVPVPIAMVSFLPLYAMLFQLILMIVGVFMFAHEYGLRVPWSMPLKVAATFMPYQLLLGFSAARGAYRELQREGSWEKTEHIGAHRLPPVPAIGSLRPVVVRGLARLRPSFNALRNWAGAYAVERPAGARASLGLAASRVRASLVRNASLARASLAIIQRAALTQVEQWRTRSVVTRATVSDEQVTQFAVEVPRAVAKPTLAQIIAASLHEPPAQLGIQAAAPERVGDPSDAPCPGCGRQMPVHARFCRRCGFASIAPKLVPAPVQFSAGVSRRPNRRAVAASIGLVIVVAATMTFLEITLASSPPQPRPREGPAQVLELSGPQVWESPL